MEKSSKKNRLITATLFATIIVIHSWTLMRYPLPFADEAWNANRAWGFIQTGRTFGSLDSDFIMQHEGYWTFFSFLPVLLQSLSLRLFSAPSLFAVRIVSLVFGLALLAAIYAIANRLGGKRLGALSVLLVSFSTSFFVSAHLARTDIYAAALGFGAIALYLNNHSGSFWPGLLSGLCVGLAFEIHPHSIICGPAIAALYFLHWRWSMFRKPHFWGFVSGGIIGVIFYAAIHILPYPETYRMFAQVFFTSTHTPPVFTLDPKVIVGAFRDAALATYYRYPTLIPLILLAIVALLKRRSSGENKTLLVLTTALALGYTLLIRLKSPYYAILFTPTIDMVVATLLLNDIDQPWQGLPADYIRRVFIWGFFSTSVIIGLMMLRVNFYKDYQAAQNRINQVIQPGDSIMGLQTFWFGLYDHDYDSWEELAYYQYYKPGSTLEDAFREFRPDIFILFGSWIENPVNPTDSYSRHMGTPILDLKTFLARHAQAVAVFDGGGYGELRVYRINWQ